MPTWRFGIIRFVGQGKPVLLGITERLEFVDTPVHAAGLARYREIGQPLALLQIQPNGGADPASSSR